MIHDTTPAIEFDDIIAADPVDKDELNALGWLIGEFVMQSVGKADAMRERSLQSEARHLGMSELGGCREYIRASVNGDPKEIGERTKWAAFVGTEVGDGVEASLKKVEPRIVTQQEVSVTLGNGITIDGHTDAQFGRRRLIDLKTKDGTDDVRLSPDGPDFKEKVQISGYLIGLIEKGLMDEDATAHLVYLDRSGRDPKAWVFSITAQEARGWLVAAEERLEEVAHALATGASQGPLRDMPESWCFRVQCPFYTACWGGEEYNPTNQVDPYYDEFLEMYDRGRAQKKAGENLIRNAKAELNPEPGNDDLMISGMGERLRIKWTLKENQSGWVTPTIDVREIPAKELLARNKARALTAEPAPEED